MSDPYLRTSPASPNVEAVPPMLPALKAAETHEIDQLRKQLAEMTAQRDNWRRSAFAVMSVNRELN